MPVTRSRAAIRCCCASWRTNASPLRYSRPTTRPNAYERLAGAARPRRSSCAWGASRAPRAVPGARRGRAGRPGGSVAARRSWRGSTDAQAAEAVGILQRADILEGLGFTHPIVRSAIYEDTLPLERARLHGQAARLRSDAGASAEEVASHLMHASLDDEAWAVGALRAGATRALKLGDAQPAVQFLRRALEEGRGSDVRPVVMAELGDAELRTGDLGGMKHLQTAREAMRDPARPSHDRDADRRLPPVLHGRRRRGQGAPRRRGRASRLGSAASRAAAGRDAPVAVWSGRCLRR